MKPPKMLDNKRNGRVIDELKTSLRKGSKLSVISAYFTIYAFAELKKELGRIDSLRLLFTEPSFANPQSTQSREYVLESGGEQGVSGNQFELKLRNELRQAAIAKECAAWLKEKAQLKALKQSNPAQPRLLYIENESEHISINGTVDFTTDGLGITPSNRIDSNMCLYGKEFTFGFLQSFNELWADGEAVEDVKQQLLNQMQVLYRENTPEFIYFVTLYHVFSRYLDELTDDNLIKARTGYKETGIWKKLYRFQYDGARGAIDKLEKYNGCIIADSVGLGKTFTALAVIKYYELRNDKFSRSFFGASTSTLPPEADLFDKLDVRFMRMTDCYALYCDMVDAVSVCDAASRFGLPESATGTQARELTARLYALEKQIAALRAQFKGETQFNKKVELNMAIKKLELEVENEQIIGMGKAK